MTAGGDQVRGLMVCGRFAELEDALCERIGELRRGRPLTPVTIVVGSTMLRTRLGDLFVRRFGAIANVRIVTLSRFAVDLVTEARGAPPILLTGVARERVLRRLVASARSQGLAYFEAVCDRPHFADALGATFADLREARVDAGQPWAASAVAVQTARGRAKADDLQRLFAAYCAELAERDLFDRAGLDLAAADALASGATIGATLLYGLYDLNQAQEALIDAALRRGADVFVPLPRGAPDEGVTALDAARAAGGDVRRLPAPETVADVARLSALWSPDPVSAGGGLRLRGDGSLAVVSVSDERAEAREAVRAVLRSLEEGADLWDCAVVVPQEADVERLARSLTAAGLPVACRLQDRAAGRRLLSRLIECLSPLAGEQFSRRAVVDLLLAAPLRAVSVTPAQAALWLDEARQAGVVSGLGQWVERVGRRRRGLEARVEELGSRSAPPADDDDDGSADDRARASRRLCATRALDDGVGALSRACGLLPVRGRWSEWAAALSGVVEAVFAEPAAGAARDAAARLAALDVVDEEVDLSDAAAVLRDQLAAAQVRLGRVGRDGVAVLTPLELRGLSFHSVVFSGMAEGGFPVRGRPDPVLGDAERLRLAERSAARLPLAAARDAEATWLFAFAAEAARERLTLLAPRSDAATGRPRLPSRLLLRLASRAVGRPVGLDEFLTGVPLAAVWRGVGGPPAFDADATPVWIDARERDAAVLLWLSTARRGVGPARYLGTVLGDSAAAARRLGVVRAARVREPGPWDGLLGGDARRALGGRSPRDAEMHPTRLERYVECPFAFLLRDVLGLEAPDEPGDGLEMEPREVGTLAHRILQRTFEDVIAGRLSRADALRAVQTAWAEACNEAERRGVTGAALSWEVRRETLLADLTETIGRDPVFACGGLPVAVEWAFGETFGRPVDLELPEGRVARFAGRLDRVDETSSGVRVVDYKTGRGDTERERIKRGLSVQLPVYQLAMRQAGTPEDARIDCLYRLVTRAGGFEDLPLTDGEDVAVARLRSLVARILGLVEAGVFARSPRGRCEYCDVDYACGVSDWTRDRKRGSDALSGLVGLQTSGPGEGGGDAGV